MKLILFLQENDTVGIISVGPNEHLIELIAKADVPEGCKWKVIDANILPKDQYFRNAWVWRNNQIEVDLELAKEIKREVFRKLREPLFAPLDLEFMRAVEAKDSKKQDEVATKKQALRDVTLIEMPEDLDKLKKFIPKILQDKTSPKT